MGKRLRSFSISLLFILPFASCSIDSFDQVTDLPAITSVIPQVLSHESAQIELQVSRPVINHRNIETCFRFAKTNRVTPALLKRAEKAKSSEVVAPFLPANIQLSPSRDKIQVTPGAKLEYGESYSLYLFACFRDDAGAPLRPTAHEFVVEAAPFRIASHDIILPGDSLASPGRKYFHFLFSHPIDAKDLNLNFGNIPTQKFLSEDGRELLVELQGELLANTKYEVSFESLLKEPIIFTTGSVSKPRVLLFRNFHITGYESQVEVEANVPFLFRLSARIDGKNVTGRERLLIENLLPNTQYDYEIEAENLFGEKETKTGKVSTRRVASVTINEIMANPKLPKGVTDSAGEYIELYNFGDEPVNLTGFTIDVEGKLCSITSKANRFVILPAKSLMILVGKKFDPAIYQLSDSTAIFRMSTQTVCGNLRNWPMPSILLKDEAGRKISRFSSMPNTKEKGFSVERLNPSEKHGKEQYCYSRTDVGPTPLRMNGISEKGCE